MKKLKKEVFEGKGGRSSAYKFSVKKRDEPSFLGRVKK